MCRSVVRLLTEGARLCYNSTRGDIMEPRDYVLDRVEGEYAYLKDIESGNEIFIALALLPQGATVGSKLHCEMFEYTLIN